MENSYREQALINLKDNGVSLVNMEVYIRGYIDGRKYVDKELLKMIPDEMVPINELWFKNKDGSITKTVFIESKESANWVEETKETFKNLGY